MQEKNEVNKKHLSELPNKGDTIVGNDVWIGQNVTIMPGVHIVDGAVIGANSVVAKMYLHILLLQEILLKKLEKDFQKMRLIFY